MIIVVAALAAVSIGCVVAVVLVGRRDRADCRAAAENAQRAADRAQQAETAVRSMLGTAPQDPSQADTEVFPRLRREDPVEIDESPVQTLGQQRSVKGWPR